MILKVLILKIEFLDDLRIIGFSKAKRRKPITLSEFRHWLEGFEESFTHYPPNIEQWNKIKEKLSQVGVLPIKIDSSVLPNHIPYKSPTTVKYLKDEIWYSNEPRTSVINKS